MHKIAEKIQRIFTYRTHRYKGVLVTLGGALDDYGVYTVADIIPDNAVVLSFGIGTDTAFEETILQNYKDARIYAFDPTPKSQEYVKRLADEERFMFFPYGLSKNDGEETFYLPQDDSQVSCSMIKNMYSSERKISVEMKCFSSVLQIIGGLKWIDLIKMDIEGTEFEVIDSILGSGIEIKQLCLEIHPGYFNDRYRKSRDFTYKMLKMGYEISHITRNGLGEELSFIKGGLLR